MSKSWQCPHCQFDYHPGPLTYKVSRMIVAHYFDPYYDPETDVSPIICPGSDVAGPVKRLEYTDLKYVETDLEYVDPLIDTSWNPFSKSIPYTSGGGAKEYAYPSCYANVDFDKDPLKVMLLTSEYVPNDEHLLKTDIHPAHEVVGVNYTAGGAHLTSVTVNYDSKSNTISVDAANVCWANASFTARYAVIYCNVEPYYLIARIDFGADVIAINGNLTIEWAPGGFLKITDELGLGKIIGGIFDKM